MKATINGIQFEGTPQEMLELLASSANTANTQSADISKSKKQSVEKSIFEASFETQKQSSKYFPGTSEFLAALFRYKPSNTSMGREAYVVQMLATGQAYTLKQLVRGARTDLQTVKQAIDRAVDADCVIHATRLEGKQFAGSQSLTLTSKVKMLSLGSIERANEVKSRYRKKNASGSTDVVRPLSEEVPFEASLIKDLLLAAKSNSLDFDKKSKASKKNGVIDTGSAPITKIIYAEDRKKNEQQ